MTSPGARPLAAALVEEACKKSAMLWLQPEGQERACAAWHVWVDGAVHLVSGGLEQRLPPMADGRPVRVTVRSKDNGTRLVTWVGLPVTLAPDSPEWQRAVVELHAKRLNAPDGDQQPRRWAAESTVTRLQPTGDVVEAPGRMPSGSLAAEPPGSPATTRGALPFVIGRRARRRR
jgi:hypothetical protein